MIESLIWFGERSCPWKWYNWWLVVSWLLSLTSSSGRCVVFVSMFVTAFRAPCLHHALSPHSHSVKNVERTSSFHASSLSTRTRTPTSKTAATRNVSSHKRTCTLTRRYIKQHSLTQTHPRGERSRCVGSSRKPMPSFFCWRFSPPHQQPYCLSLSPSLSLSPILSFSLFLRPPDRLCGVGHLWNRGGRVRSKDTE